MTSERRDEPTPAGGEYSVAVFVDLATLEEVDKAAATGIVVSEFNGDGTLIMETVAEFSEQP